MSPAAPPPPCFCGDSAPEPLCRLRKAKLSFVAPERSTRVARFTPFVQNPACLLADVSKLESCSFRVNEELEREAQSSFSPA